ncbi:MAG: hypothetical protein Q4G03_11820, partial [Planctomycetia bacterium]|nr:hypothetical protein [Planctomycetia bacterium]
MKRSQVKHSAAPKTPTALVACLAVLLLTSLWSSHASAATRTRVQNAQSVTPSAVDSPETKAKSENLARNDDDQDSETIDDKSFPGFRFWMAPANAIDRWPWGERKYYPIEIETFNDWLSAIQEREKLERFFNGRYHTGVVATLRLDGRLDGDAFVGSGALDTFHQLPLSASSSQEESHAPLDANLFPLQPFSMALSSPSEPSDSIDELIPTYPDGQFYLPNLDSKTRRFRWSQRGRVDSLGVTRVDLSFPSAIRTVLNLETPANTTLTSSNGSVEELTNASEPLAPRLWRVTLGATGGTRVTVTPNMTQDVGDKPRLSSYRQETTYRFSREGCETVARFEFEKTDASNIEMELALDAPLALLSVEWNGHAHEFFTDFAAQDANGVRLKLRPQETLGVESVDELKIVAFAPLTLGISKAPRIRLETQTYSWRETVWRMSASQPLAITATHAHDATQARDAIRSRADVSSTRVFKLFRYDADVSVTLEEQRHAPLFDSATDCHVIGGDVFAKTTLFFNFDANSNGRVELPLADAWDVDAVQTAREEPFSWICQPQSDDANRRVLVLNFERAPEPNQATVAVVSARYLGAVESKIAVDKLCPLDLSGALNGAHALALRAESPKEVKLTTGSGRAIVAPPANVDFVFGEAQIREALPLSLGGARLYFGDQTLDAYASFETNRINYSVDLTCRCDLHADSYVENWRLHCAPANGARVERLVFFVSPSTQGTVAERRVWTWSTASDPDKTYEATRLTPEEAAAMHVPDNVDVYEIRMTTSRSVPFDLNLFHTTPFAFAVQAPLVFFPESVGQTAEFVIKASLDLPYWVQVDSPTEFSESDMLWDSPSHNALWSSTAPTVATEQYESLTRAYRYKSSIDSDVGDSFRAPGLTIYSYPPENSAYVTDQTSSANALCWNQQYDAYYEVGELVRNRIVFFIENSGRQTVSLFFPETIAPDQLRSVLIDSRPTEWFLREETDSDLRWGVDVCLLPDRRFVCLEIEFVTPEPRGRIIRRLKPSDVTLDMPVLSGKWSVWAPPQFQTYGAHGLFNDGRRDAISWARSVWDDLCAPRERLDHMRSQALRCYSRLGDQSALRFAIGESRSASGQSRVDAATWGDVFGSATVIEQLFAPAIGPANQKDDVEEEATVTSADSKTDGVDSNVIDSPFGRLQRSTRPFELYVDRYALARVGVLPSTLTPQTPNASPLECADDMLELSGLFLIYLDENFALLTTREESQRYDNLATVSACGSNARMVQSYSQARAFRDKIVSSATQRFVSATQWRQSDPTISPWHERSKAEYALGWRRWSTPLARADRGVVVTGSYFLDAITLACFACLLIITWRRLSISIRLLLGVLGVSIAAILVCRLEVQAGARGFAFAAFCSIIARFFTPKRQEDKGKDAVNEPKADPVMTRRHKASEEKDGAVGVAHDASQSHETTAGFVDLKDARVREALLHAEQDDSQRLGENAPERDAKVSMKLCCALALATAIALSASLGLSRVRAQQSPMPTPGVQRNASAPSVTARATDHEFDANPVEETELNQEEQEPYRVFAPIDENQRPTGEYYWIDSEFYQRIRTALRARPRQRNWRVVDAFYQGALNYNSFTETTSLFNLKATYRIVTEEPNVTLALPAVQLTSDGGARFDRQTVSAIYDEAGSELLIELENVEPGEHLLELTLIAPQFTAEENHDAVPQISVPILPCASARLELTASIDAPKVDVPNAMGRVWRSPGSLAADLGAIDRLTLTLEPNGERSNKTSVEVEQYFLLRPRTTQMDARAAFHYQVVGGKVQSLEIECDPSYAFSGYCKCDAVEIDTVEPPTSQNNAMRVTFKKPASGSFTLNVDFVARNFAGIGAISFPKIATRGAHVDKNWLAISPGANVDYTLDLGVTEEQIGDVAVRATEFKAAWGELADSPNVAYDLALVSRDASIHTSVRSPLPEVDLVETLLFRAASVELELDALIEATSELYDLRLTTPHPFVLDSIELTDLNEDQEEG